MRLTRAQGREIDRQEAIKDAGGMRLTRRQMAKLGLGTLGALAMPRLASAADPDYTIAVIPDAQYLGVQNWCGSMSTTPYQTTINRIVSDQAAWNIQAVVSTGDCVNTT